MQIVNNEIVRMLTGIMLCQVGMIGWQIRMGMRERCGIRAWPKPQGQSKSKPGESGEQKE